jgi:hypothetical protein
VKSALAFIALFAVCLVGCSGNGDQTGRGDVMGIVFDEEGFPVRDAHVYFDGAGSDKKNAQTNSNGVYVLTDVPAGDQNIRVEVNRGDNRFYGQNIARIAAGERTMNHNIAVYIDTRLAAIEGFVSDRQGYRLQGVRVFVKQRATNTVLTSAYGITDGDGHYVVGGLRANIEYDVQVNAYEYNSDFDSFILNSGERRMLNFTVPLAEDVVFTPPDNVVATAWTSPAVRSTSNRDLLDTMKAILKPGTKPSSQTRAQTRTTSGGNVVEIDITWDAIIDPALLGYGIYRSDNGGTLRDIYFVRDPLAELFADMDDVLRENRNYTYRVTTLATIGSESAYSPPVSAVPLGDLVLRNPTGGSRPTFRWNQAVRADTYTVYLFNQYPTIGVTDIWNNDDQPTTGTSFQYTGSALGSGKYYYIVVGTSTAGSYTLSPVGELTVL